MIDKSILYIICNEMRRSEEKTVQM